MPLTRWHLAAGLVSLSVGAAGYVLYTPAAARSRPKSGRRRPCRNPKSR
jgi:hypothetical protein